MNLDTRMVNCPYCNEAIELAFERVDGLQEYIEDCHVCCQPISVRVTVDAHSSSYDLVCTTMDEI
jgi:copper chaperone CopZ